MENKVPSLLAGAGIGLKFVNWRVAECSEGIRLSVVECVQFIPRIRPALPLIRRDSGRCSGSTLSLVYSENSLV